MESRMTEQKLLVSVIVPTRNSSRYLSQCLQSIRDQDYANIELIVVDRYSTDLTVAIAHSFDAIVLSAGPERSAQVNFGAHSSRGDYLFRVDSDFKLEPSVVSECVDLMGRGADAIAVHNTADEVGWLSRIRKFEVDMYKFSLDHSAARFISREVFLTIGGYNENLTAGEDYDFQNRITASGFRTLFCHAEAVHLDEPLRLSLLLRKYFAYGRDFPKFKQQNAQRSRTQLAFFRKDFFRHWKRLIRHPFMTVELAIYHSLKYFAGGLGYISSKFWPPPEVASVSEHGDSKGLTQDG
jgi:glycosyltransferase involved in cell wall biosynthesis